jgi:hypothetical protein
MDGMIQKDTDGAPVRVANTIILMLDHAITGCRSRYYLFWRLVTPRAHIG